MSTSPLLRAEGPPDGPLAAKLQPFVDDGSMAGAVMLVASKDKILDLEAVGYADLAAKKPMAPDDLFWIASMTKAMTAGALMMLVDEGKVKVDDPVEKYLPDFHNLTVVDPKDPTHTPHPAAHPITIREILSHSSGLPFKSAEEKPTLDALPLAQAVASYATHSLAFQPGTEYLYANAGINTAARIVEVVSGEPYEKFMQERLFDPLGMRETTFWPTAEQLQRLARAYDGPVPNTPPQPGHPAPATPPPPADPNAPKLKEISITQLKYPLDDRVSRHPMPAGGLFSTATDVARFCQMFLNNGTLEGKTYLSPAAVKAMTTKETAPAVKTSYGFGWSVGAKGDFSHGGAYKTYMGVDPAHGIVLVFLVQQGGHWGTAHGSEILHTFITAAHALASGPSLPAADTKVQTEGQQMR